MLEKYKINETKNDFSSKPEPYPKEITRLIPAMKAYLAHRNLDYNLAKDNMWYPTDKVKELDPVVRIVIPCTNTYNRPYWQARAILSHKLRYRSAKGGRFGSIVIVWPKDLFVVGDKCVVLVEGPMDALAAAMLGHLAVATMGATFSKYALKYIFKKITKAATILVIPDLDCPEFGTSAVQYIAKHGYSGVIRMPVGKSDFAAMSLKLRKELLKI